MSEIATGATMSPGDRESPDESAARAASVSYSAGLRRDLEVLRILASEESLRRSGLGVVHIARLLGREKSQVSRALRALAAEGLVERDPSTRTFQLGWGLYQLAARGVETRLVRAASVQLHRLAERCHSEARARVLIRNQILTLLIAGPGETPRTPPPADASPTSLASTPAGPALLADWTDAAIVEVSSRQGFDAALLTERVRHVRRHGYVSFVPDSPDLAMTDRSSVPGSDSVTGTEHAVAPGHPPVSSNGHETPIPRIAVPVRDFRGIVLAAIEMGTEPGTDSGDQVRAVQEAAAALSATLGYEVR